MDPYALPTSPHYETAIFNGNSMSAGQSWQTWRKPFGKSHAYIIAIAAGGGGGAGAIGAASTAAGGGGGGSSNQTIIDIPLDMLPARLYVSVGVCVGGTGWATYVSTQPNLSFNHMVTTANGGSAGGAASGATAGSGGFAGSAATQATMPLGWAFLRTNLAGQTGGVGGTTGAGVNITITTGASRTSPGTGGAGLAAAATSGSAGGALSPFTTSIFPTLVGGTAGTAATTPPGAGQNGLRIGGLAGDLYFMGGTGGGSTYGSATGAGLVQAAGGNGAIGSGGGGSGGALTGSTAATASVGGPGLVMILCY